MSTRSVAKSIAEQCLAMRMRRLNRVITRIYDEELRPYDVGVAQLNALVALGLAGELQPAQLGAVLDVEKSTLSRNLRRLEERGWIDIVGQGSAQRVSLTARGEAVLGKARPAWERAQKRAQETLGGELAGALGAIPVI
ncbi:MarR family transcriptional regulator [Pendulispora brunnea]|uniref:MarR family transcriptional regulator n=1 Tax=Pendulispora brunnea TaxID=2905690 RepID=A0ABZ2KH42_9BACT